MKNVNSIPEAISNLREYYKDCLGYPEKSGKRSLAAEILANIIEDGIEENDVFFSIVYEEGNDLMCIQGNHEFVIPKKNVEVEKAIQNFYKGRDNKKPRNTRCDYFRCAGVWVDEDNVIKGKIYYVFRIYDQDEIQPIYLNAFEEAYYEWVKKEILRVANPFIKYKKYGKEYRNIIDQIIERTEDIFEEKMLNLYGIDLGIITEISGNYYEGGKCNSVLKLKIGNSKVKGVSFVKKDCVEIKKENVRNLRKILEMCKEEQCIFAERGADLKWTAKGICNDISNANDVLFKISDHMFWEMRIGDKHSVCYKYGKYTIRDSLKKSKKFCDDYEKLFGKKANKYIKKIFEEAKEQAHGTSIIILGDDSNDKVVQIEVNRLLKESSGIAIKSKIKMPSDFVKGVTSIDGAVIMDKSGKCYAIGAILDGNAAIKGDRAHGARHNSVMRYIKTKKDEGLKGLGIIISEDKTIRFVSTEDNFGGHEDELR